MHLSAVHHAGPLLDLTAVGKRVSSTASGDVPETTDTFQQALTANSSGTGTLQDMPFPAAEVASAPAPDAPNSTVPAQQLTSTQATTPNSASTDASGLLTTLKTYASASQGSSQAYQEYAKAWGGRVVHGQVELPPLSIYLE